MGASMRDHVPLAGAPTVFTSGRRKGASGAVAAGSRAMRLTSCGRSRGFHLKKRASEPGRALPAADPLTCDRDLHGSPAPSNRGKRPGKRRPKLSSDGRMMGLPMFSPPFLTGESRKKPRGVFDSEGAPKTCGGHAKRGGSPKKRTTRESQRSFGYLQDWLSPMAHRWSAYAYGDRRAHSLVFMTAGFRWYPKCPVSCSCGQP